MCGNSAIPSFRLLPPPPEDKYENYSVEDSNANVADDDRVEQRPYSYRCGELIHNLHEELCGDDLWLADEKKKRGNHAD
jgi:hypothetical protein